MLAGEQIQNELLAKVKAEDDAVLEKIEQEKKFLYLDDDVGK